MKYLLLLLPICAYASEPVDIVYMPKPPEYILQCTEKTCTPYQMSLKEQWELMVGLPVTQK